MAKLWDTSKGGAGPALDPMIEAFLSSITFDNRLLPEDLEGSIAHAAMLGDKGILPEATARELVKGLEALAAGARDGSVKVDLRSEDVHSFVETALTEKLGDAGRSLHAGRSRNDQIAVDIRLWLKKRSRELRSALLDAMDAVCELASDHIPTLMPGYTHLQRAQPVTFAHHLSAWCAALERDYGRLEDADRRADECPLGACALAGTGLPVDREATAAALGFARPTRNSMDSVADRDALVEFASAAATMQMHLSRFCEEIVLWASAEFGFVSIDQSCSTGSSVMPQKRNPDPAELIRGKAGRAYGDLVGLLVIQKGLPLAYGTDLQEDKELVFDSADTAIGCARAFARLVRALQPKPERMREAAEDGCLWAADAAEFLVLKGVPFRTAYVAGRKLVEARAAAAGPARLGRSPAVAAVIADLGAEGLSALHGAWKGVDPGELSRYLSLDACISRRDLVGGPAPARARAEIERLRSFTAGRRPTLK
jgi:argininosuccinate lyase